MNESWADIFPYFAGALKLIILAIGAYYAIKWHFDEDRRLREEDGEVVDRASLMKKVMLIAVLPVVLITLVVYATNWVLEAVTYSV